jgi:hypothetical protein
MEVDPLVPNHLKQAVSKVVLGLPLDLEEVDQEQGQWGLEQRKMEEVL